MKGAHAVLGGIVPEPMKLLRIELDDKLLFNGRQGALIPCRQRENFPPELSLVDFHPRREASLFNSGKRLLNLRDAFALLPEFDHVTSFEKVGRNVDLFAVYQNMTVTDELPRFLLCAGKTHALYHVVEPALQKLEQVVSGYSFHALGLFEITTELTLENAINAPDFLLFPQLQTIFRLLDPGLSMLPRRITPPRDAAFICITTLRLEK